jgi:hypothetical protein
MSIVFNPFSGNFDFTKNDNFSIKNIPEGCSICIPENQQMIVYGPMLIEGEFFVLGEVVIL